MPINIRVEPTDKPPCGIKLDAKNAHLIRVIDVLDALQ